VARSARVIELDHRSTERTPEERLDLPFPSIRGRDPTRSILDLLEIARELVGMQVAFVGEIRERRLLFRWVSGDASSFGYRAGAGVPLSDTYWSMLISGILPTVLRDTSEYPLAKEIPATAQAHIGAYVGVPITRPDGSVFGVLCLIDHEPHPALDEHDERFAVILATLIGEQVARADAEAADRHARFDLVRRILDVARTIRVELQPIVELRSGHVVGYEALSRFADETTPDQLLADAGRVDVGSDVELAMLRGALTKLHDLPPDVYLGINASPQCVLTPGFSAAIEGYPLDRIVLELTEHDEVADYLPLRRCIDDLRARGARLAVDDLGAGFASLRHVLHLSPNILKLDISLTRGVDQDSTRAALTSLFVSFADRIGATVVAEGVETIEERAALTALGVPMGQGFLLGMPSVSTAQTTY
jgi:EAL domain-containing protein (putative c-di-GMP-specific phosphodiesterase class I)